MRAMGIVLLFFLLSPYAFASQVTIQAFITEGTAASFSNISLVISGTVIASQKADWNGTTTFDVPEDRKSVV